MPDRRFSGKLADPAFRRERARKAANASHAVDAHLRAVVTAEPDELSAAVRRTVAKFGPLSAEQKAKLSTLLRGSSDSGGAAA